MSSKFTSKSVPNLFSYEKKKDRFEILFCLRFPSEFIVTSHKVITDDNFELTLHHITTNYHRDIKKTVLLQHGIVESSISWIIGGKNSIVYHLIKNNCDVWLGNNRGNEFTKYLGVINKSKPNLTRTSSFSHKKQIIDIHSIDFNDEDEIETISKNIAGDDTTKIKKSKSLYDLSKDIIQNQKWSFHEMGIYDLSSFLKYIYDNTNGKKITYIGFSQGCGQCIALLSVEANYEKYFEKLVFISPPITLGSDKTISELILQKFTALCLFLGTFVHYLIYHSWFAVPSFVEKALNSILSYGLMLFVYWTGLITKKLSYRDSKDLFRHMPSGGLNLGQIAHYGQLVLSRGMISHSVLKHKHSTSYCNKHINTPISILIGDKDTLVGCKNIEKKAKSLFKNVKNVHILPNLGHCDLTWNAHKTSLKLITAETLDINE